ncbi:MAG TPA: alpha/beta hydrolase, partial [Sorangium sp.]|nr:alpha/beta hydrolase [Sorangium sp.]
MVRLNRVQRFEGMAARALLALPHAAVAQLAGEPIERQGRRLDAQVQLLLRLSRLTGKPHSHQLSVARARRLMDVSAAQMVAQRSPLASIEERHIGGCTVRIYRPLAAPQHGPALLYFHGGGYLLGSLDSHDAPCRELAARCPCTVLSVDYRLAPEHPYPAAVDDALMVFRAVVAQAPALGIDARRIAVGGDSAGGNLAAVLSQDTIADTVRPCFQLLIYPAVDMTMSSDSMVTMGAGFYLERDTITWFCDHYLNGADPRQVRASPLFASDMAGLPPALVITAGFDPLR